MPDVVAIYRNPAYSPLQHRNNDTAILDATVDRLADRGWKIVRTNEVEVANGHLPAAAVYLNMCQGPLASEQLMPLEEDGVIVINRPSSVLNCHRHRLVKHLVDSTLSFPKTLVLPSTAVLSLDQLRELAGEEDKIWIKRGDVHAERPEDVLAVPATGVAAAMAAFAERGIAWVALQQHVPGPVVKFYAVADGRFFRWYPASNGSVPPIVEDRLKALAFDAASHLNLEVFGGDVAFPRPDRPVLIDINDWPSFAPFREQAAQAIADYIFERLEEGKPK
ncbi:MAG TPA: hypothetical protein VMH88_14425 [Gemmatimonadales bacterium]|nr:hypothetical protein [Gemmatimonadales bacterium]